ncbi:MAG: hypothetical protein NT062_16985 [Proteobacteria bacterium]|nr:hypothetical protein [Pseudomonadota bacterium]
MRRNPSSVLWLALLLTGCVQDHSARSNTPSKAPSVPAAPSLPDPATVRVTHLSIDSRTPLVEREAKLVAGYYNGTRAKEPRFLVKEQNGNLFISTLGLLDLENKSTSYFDPARIEKTVDQWLLRGNWHPMVPATRIEWKPAKQEIPEREAWALADLNIIARVNRTSPSHVGFTRASDGAYLGSSPPLIIGDVPGRTIHDETSVVEVDNLAYDPVSHLVWVAYRVVGDYYSDEERVKVFYMSDATAFPRLETRDPEPP